MAKEIKEGLKSSGKWLQKARAKMERKGYKK